MIQQKEKYLIISHNYWPAIGGAEKLFQSIAENLKASNQDVTVLTSNAKNCLMYFSSEPELVGEEREIINGVLIYRENIKNIIQKLSKIIWKLIFKRTFLRNHLEPIFVGPHFFKSVIKYIFSKDKYTHILCGPFPTSVPFYGYLFKILSPGALLILDPSLHINDPTHTGFLLKFIARKSDAILVRTEEERIFLKSWNINEKKIIEIGVGVDEHLLNNIDDVKMNLNFCNYVLYIGQEVEHKNIHVLIDAMKKNWMEGFDNKLVIAGARTKYSEVIDKKIKSLDEKYSSNIIRLNDFNDELKISLIDNSKFLVLPSSRESFGIVFIEAWARKKAVIGANVPGVRYLIDDKEDGLLFTENDSDDLANKIKYYLSNDKEIVRAGLNGYEKVLNKYTWNNIIKKIIAIR